MTDPTDDKSYEGLTLSDYLRHFVPQVKEQQAEIIEINKAGSKPFPDPNFPETSAPILDRKARRQAQRKAEKAAKKAAKK